MGLFCFRLCLLVPCTLRKMDSLMIGLLLGKQIGMTSFSLGVRVKDEGWSCD